MEKEKPIFFSEGELGRLESLKRLYEQGQVGGPEDKPLGSERKIGAAVKEEDSPMEEHLSGRKFWEKLPEGFYLWLRDDPENPLLVAFDFAVRLYPELHVKVGIFPDNEGREIPNMKGIWIDKGYYPQTAPKLYEIKQDPAMIYLNVVFSMFGVGIGKDIERLVEKNFISAEEAKFILGFGYGRQIKRLEPGLSQEAGSKIIPELEAEMKQLGVRSPSPEELQRFILNIVEKHLGRALKQRPAVS